MGDDTEALVTCPECEGKGPSPCFVDGVRDGKSFGEMRMIDCFGCGGTGKATVAKVLAYTKGRAMAEDRKSRLVTMRDEAKRLGISAKELGDLEWGRTVQ
jgi:hypothetical protein